MPEKAEKLKKEIPSDLTRLDPSQLEALKGAIYYHYKIASEGANPDNNIILNETTEKILLLQNKTVEDLTELNDDDFGELWREVHTLVKLLSQDLRVKPNDAELQQLAEKFVDEVWMIFLNERDRRFNLKNSK